MYKGFLVSKVLLDKDPHFAEGCAFCHKGDEKGQTKEAAHKGMLKRPSDDLSTCGSCHEGVAKTYKNSLHYTTAGQKHGIRPRFSEAGFKTFEEKVFEKSCRSCHASCGDCHVKGPVISGVSIGLINGHQFVKRDEAKTCAFCHGGRVYPEFTGEYGGSTDVHYQKGMMCMDCHKKMEFHGSEKPVTARSEIQERPACSNCHKIGQEKGEKAKTAHATHAGRVSCGTCHSGAPYRNCYDCHAGKGAAAKPAFVLGLSPKDHKTVTTLRVVPTIRDTFKSAGIAMDSFDSVPNYWETVPHNIKKRTERTRSCDVCHVEKKDFLTKESLIKNGSRANEKLIYTPKPIKK